MTAQHIICLNTEAELLFSSKFSELELISAREIMQAILFFSDSLLVNKSAAVNC